MTDLRKAAAQALKALEAQHTDRLAYSNAKRRANATCGEFKDSPLSALIESGYMQSLGKQTHEAIYALHAALAAQPQQAAADHPAYQLGFADGAAQYAHKTALRNNVLKGQP